jgi:hypothetical protein
MRILITEQEKKDILSSYVLIENVKQAKKYVELGLLSKDVLEKLISFDPSKTNKYVGWMSKIWMSEHPDLDQLRNTIEEYDVFLNKGKIKTKDINQFKTFKDLYSEVDTLNQSGEGISNKDLESDYDTVVNNEDLLIMSPHTHEASRKLGLSHFSFRDCGNGQKDSFWCTTYKSPDHFNKYYYTYNVTFYYIKVKSQQMIEQLKLNFPDKWERLIVVALATNNKEWLEGFDGLDRSINRDEIDKFLSIIGFSKKNLTQKRTKEERVNNSAIAELKKIERYIKDGSKGDLTLTLCKSLGDLTSVEGKLTLDKCSIKSLDKLKSVTTLVIADTLIESLGSLTSVNGNINIQSCPNFNSFGNLTSVNGDLIIMRCPNFNSFGNLTSVNGDLTILGCPNLESFGDLTSVGGSAKLFIIETPLYQKYTENILKKMINVGNKFEIIR